MDMHDKMLEDIKEAGELYGYGTQAYFEAVARIEETYFGQSEFIQQQMQNVFNNNQRLRDEDIVQYVAYTGDIAAANVDLQMDFGDTFMGIQTGCDDLQTYFSDKWMPALHETFDNVIEKTEEYNQRNEEAMEAAGTTMDSFRDRASQDIHVVTDETIGLVEETEKYGKTAAEEFGIAAEAWRIGPGSLLDSIHA
jgi:microcompartment protein CcmL/EutN